MPTPPTIQSTPPATRPVYRLLPGRVPRLRWSFVRQQNALWLGADELVQVETMFWNEKTRRFAYAHVHALLLRETPRGWIYSAVTGVLAATFGLLAWGAENSVVEGMLAVFAAVFGLMLAYNAGRGGTCRCTLQTALGPLPLPSLSRRRPARQALSLIAQRVEAAQGVMAAPTPAAGSAREETVPS